MQCTTCTTPIRPVVAVDIDGTMAGYHRPLWLFAKKFFNRHVPCVDHWDGSGKLRDYFNMTQAEYEQLKMAFRQGGFKRFTPAYEAAHQVRLAHQRNIYGRGFELWVTTTRPYLRLDSTDPDTRFWLDQQRIPYDHLLYDEHKYTKLGKMVGERLCLVIDDLPPMVREADMVCENAYMIRRPHNENMTDVVAMGDINPVQDHQVAHVITKCVSDWYRHHDIHPISGMQQELIHDH